VPGPTAANSAQQLHYGASPCARSLLGGSPTGEEDTQVCGLSEELVKQIVQIQLGELKALFQEKHGSCRGRYVGSGPWLRRKLGLSTSKAQATLDAKFDTLVVGDEEHPRYDQRTAERLRKAFLKKHGWAPNSDIETSPAWVEERLGLVDGRWGEGCGLRDLVTASAAVRGGAGGEAGGRSGGGSKSAVPKSEVVATPRAVCGAQLADDRPKQPNQWTKKCARPQHCAI
jgi:hypothetical protein